MNEVSLLPSVLNFLRFTVMTLGLCYELGRIKALGVFFIPLIYVYFIAFSNTSLF